MPLNLEGDVGSCAEMGVRTKRMWYGCQGHELTPSGGRRAFRHGQRLMGPMQAAGALSAPDSWERGRGTNVARNGAVIGEATHPRRRQYTTVGQCASKMRTCTVHMTSVACRWCQDPAHVFYKRCEWRGTMAIMGRKLIYRRAV